MSNLLELTLSGNAEGIEKCIANGDNINVQLPDPWFENGPKYETCMHAAVRYQLYDICMLLAKAGAKLDLRNSDGMTPLDVAEPAFQTTLISIFSYIICLQMDLQVRELILILIKSILRRFLLSMLFTVMEL